MQLKPIAIIGIGCRFPGAQNPQAFWSMIRDGVDGVSEVPTSRWDADSYYDPDQSKPGKANTRWGGFLEDITQFEPQFFGIAPKEAVTMDPQQRLLLEVAWETLEDAGQVPEDLKGSKTGVFIGIGTHDYSIMMWQQPVSEPYATTGTGNCIAANRISYVFDFKGPSLAVDTACSSSLVSVHLACQSIWTGESKLALAGGVNMLLLPTIMVGFSKGGFMSSDGRCKSFDASADGYVRGEGAGLILLKPLSQAQADGDDIYGVILSSAVNQDGLSNGMAAPNPVAQEAVLREAYDRGGIDPASVDYIEAHGTGTKVGDPIEAIALGKVLGEKRQPGNNCLIGSVKTNIGHTETAAGIAGIIKVALALKHQQIPPSLHFKTPNPAIAFEDLKLEVVAGLTPWPKDKPLIAGVNSFGFGGTNAHIVMGNYVVEDSIVGDHAMADHLAKEEEEEEERETITSQPLEQPSQLLVLSAKSKSALRDLAKSYQSFIPKTDAALPDICLATQTQRSHFNHRLTFISKSKKRLQIQLTAFNAGEDTAGLRESNISNQPRKICWLFTGQGSQYMGMGQQLYETQPVFRKALNRCGEILQPFLDQPLLEILYEQSTIKIGAKDCSPLPESINRTIYTQPAIFSLEYALAQLWLAWGIKPDYVMGHSIGEYVAACIAGVFSLEDALKLVAARGRLMEELPSSGGMLAVFSSQAEIAELMATYKQDVNIAAINNDQNIVIAGKRDTLTLIEHKLAQINISSKLLEVSHGFHSPLMKPMLGDFRQVATQITYGVPSIPLVSNVTAKLAGAEIANADYWVDHIVQPVKFAASFQFLLTEKVDIFLEIGAKPILSSIGKTILTTDLARENQDLAQDLAIASTYSPLLLPSLSDKQSDCLVILNSVAQLFHQGIKLDWQAFNQNYSAKKIKLPTYPFQRQQYWWSKAKFWTDRTEESKASRAEHLSTRDSLQPHLQQDLHQHLQQYFHPLLGNPLTLAIATKKYFQGQIQANSPEYLQDHCLENQTVFPATAYLEMALAAAQYIYSDLDPDGNLELRDFTLKKPLLLSDTVTELQTVVERSDNGDRLKIFSKAELENDFTLHSEVMIKTFLKEDSGYTSEGLAKNIADIKSRLQPVSDPGTYYQKLKDQGLNYGDRFQGIKQLWRGDKEALGYIQLPESISRDLVQDKYLLHPALLDSCFQLIGATTEADTATNNATNQGLYLPVSIGSLKVYRNHINQVWAQVNSKLTDDSHVLQADLLLIDNAGELLAEVRDLSLQYLSRRSLRQLIDVDVNGASIENQDNVEDIDVEDINDWLYEIEWETKDLEPSITAPSDPNNSDLWLIFADKTDLSQKLADKLSGVLVSPGEVFKSLGAKEYIVNPNQQNDLTQLWEAINFNLDFNRAANLRIAYVSKGCSRTTLTHYQDCISIFNLMQSFSAANLNPDKLAQLTIITKQTQFESVNNLSGAVWGLGRTIQQEYPSLSCSLVDLDNLDDLDHQNSEQLLSELLLPELLASDGEGQVAYRQGQRYVARLSPKDNTLNNPHRLQLSDYGTLDNLALVPSQRRSPKAGEIEIAVTASGVNFRDVLNALGVLKEYLQAMGFTDSTQVPFGGECAGIVAAIGPGVTNFQLGDEVIAAQAVGSLSSHVIVDARFAIAKPDDLTHAEAATIPTTFLTAYYGLHYLAKIKPGDKILIHAAAGGVGQAAVQIAQQAGAEIYATASTRKWDFLQASGIKYIMNSRTLDFVEQVMELTAGKGVDLVLNSLNGDFIPKTLEILASQGRFVEIGKVGIWDQAQIAKKRPDISYFPFDLLEVSNRYPDLIARLFAELRRQFMERKLEPLPHKTFPIQKAADAFRYMAQAKHIGKVVISLPASNQVVKSDGSYLITGGFGALGLQVANWLSSEGAKSLVLLGRSEPTGQTRQEIDKLELQGIKVTVIQADITDYETVSNIFDDSELTSPVAPIRGVIHAAGILDDGLLKSLTWESFQSVLQPKIRGAWNLHEATKTYPLDWFVCFSSIVSVFGAPGQSNYAAANGFMDNLMNHRRHLGLPGLSINWSVWDEVGMASRMTRQQQARLSQQGLRAIAPNQGLKILKQLLQQQAEQTIVFPVDWPTFLSQQPANQFWQRLQLKPHKKNKPGLISSFLQKLATLPKAEQHDALQQHIRLQISKILGYSDPEDIDTQEKFADLGMDSLMAVEFRNNLRISFGDAISLTAAFDYPNVELLTDYIAQELSVGNILTDAILTDTVLHEVEENDCSPISSPISNSIINGEIVIPTPENPFEDTTIKPLNRVNKINRTAISIKPEYSQFQLTPEYINLKKDLERVEKLGNPFFSLHQGIAQDTIKTGDRTLINYSSYNYLGLAGDPVVIEATQKAIAEYGTSVSASRVLSGERPLHLELEREIADFIGTEAAIVYVGGHATNVSTIGHLFGEQDLIICDALSHNSIKEGCNLSGAKIIDFPHNDCQALETILERERTKYQKVLIAVEGIYSTDGDLAPVPEIVELKQYYQTFLLVDEAHSIGVLGLSGGGIREHYHLKPTDVDLWMGTLSKSFASCGGYIAGCGELIQYLKYTAPGFVFSVGMSPGNTASALAAIKLLKSEPERAIKLQSRAKFCLDLAKSKGFNTGYSANSPVIPIIVGEPHKAVSLSKLLEGESVNVNPMVYPSVPYDAARLRFFITSLHTETQIQLTMNLLENLFERIN